MDLHIPYTLPLLIILSLLSVQSRVAHGTGSVYFLDSPTHHYLRPRSFDAVPEHPHSMSLLEVSATASVLLGFAPPAMLSAASSSKLNEVLMPNPFDRPRAVFMLEVAGVEDSQLAIDSDNNLFSSALKRNVVLSGDKADIRLPDENEVSVFSLNEHPSSDSDAEFTDKELSNFASWLGGSYVTDASKQLNGDLTIPLGNDDSLELHLSKDADKDFTISLVSLAHSLRRATEMHNDLFGNAQSPAELITGRFDGIKALQEYYGTEGVAEKGMKLFVTTISRLFESVNAAYKGQIVGIIFYNNEPLPESMTMLNLIFTSQPTARWLEETTKDAPNATTVAEVILVRRIVAWITGIVLIIATLIGIYFLLNMPLTKDTLLYSNVKLD